VCRPSIHKTTTLLEQISAVANHMRQRRLGDLARKIGALGRPVSKRGSEAMGRQVATAHAPQSTVFRADRQETQDQCVGELAFS
jgi:hypothetical protein